MKLGELLKSHKYKIQDELDYNLMRFILNLELKIDKEDTKKVEVKPRKAKSKVTFLEKLSKYKSGDKERDFIIDILENNPKYRSYKYTYLEWLNLYINNYTNEKLEDIFDPYDTDIYRITKGEVSKCDIIDGVEDIDKMIEIFKEKLLVFRKYNRFDLHWVNI